MQPKPWLLVDGGWLAYRALWASKENSWELVVFGMLEQLRVVCLDSLCQSNRVALFFDSQVSYRKRDFPAYKSGRKSSRTEDEVERRKSVYDAMRFVSTQVCPALGIACYIQEGYEADDLIASACRLLEFGDVDRGIIITSDSDLYQLISNRVDWYDPSKRLYYNKLSFRVTKGVSPCRWAEVKALAGCMSDCVPGIVGVGEKTAIRYLNDLPVSDRRRGAIESYEGQEIADRNLRLVRLPYPGTVGVSLLDSSMVIEALDAVCKSNYIRLGDERLHDWRMIASGKFSASDRQRERQRKRSGS
jgi:5'-3' exonuclease